ncbi:ammonia-dependent NAD(+) synthetase [Periweissella fabalis]|uniref:NH(3)-dependent NAD(+) synthetase n=1 Tax=Periweissella fabalis TaxID=1070421 RepID=A0A7X6S2V5_9LACO|nr:ammonia-dependent NAD(+) synthetase [Periweissella fabalis]MCM0599784.1 ammonia-dependent NAD(+) synthetase [Periweissella fabalis]NKZ24410.1 ammonia-dependent NAD(+) synthetase [Periweissella fabalis]
MRALQAEIIEKLGVQPKIDPHAEIRRSVEFLKDYLIANPFLKTLVLGISGGQDSTLAGKLAQMAISELREETGDQTYQFIAVRLPYGEQADESDAMDAIAFQNADRSVRINIKEATDTMVAALQTNDNIEITDYNKGNIKARQRMIAQFAIAGATNGAVIGTDHAAEAITGFYTKFGDGAADITPLYRLNKRQGKAMLAVLGAPEHLYLKVPTADLEEDRPALPDEVALGVTYDDIDDYLEGREIVDATATIIEKWYTKTEHKRQLPISVFDNWYKKD